MAEVVGVVASGIAIATLAGKLTKSCVKLKDCWNQVKEIPADITFLTSEIESLNLILSHISAGQRVPDLVFDNMCLQQSLKLCEDGVAELVSLVEELATMIEGKAGWRKKAGSLKVVLKKDELKRIKSRMKSSIRILSLAYQCHTSAMIQLQPEIIVARVTAHIALSSSSQIQSSSLPQIDDFKKETDGTTASSSIMVQHYRTWTSDRSWMHFLLGSFEYRAYTKNRRGREVQEIDTKFRMPSWISQTTYQAQFSKPFSHWQIKPRWFRVLPYDHPFFVAIESGDIPVVQKMLSDRTAFVTDRSHHYDFCVLHMVKHPDMLKLLLAEGADPMAASPFYSSPLKYHAYFEHDSTNSIELIQCFLGTEAIECLDDFTWGLVEETDIFDILSNQAYPVWHQRDLSYRVDAAICYVYYALYPSVEQLERILHCDMRDLRKASVHHNSKSLTLLHALSIFLAKTRYVERDIYAQEVEKLFEFVRIVVEGGADVHSVSNNEMTPLAMLWNEYRPYGFSTQVLKTWLCWLYKCGVDLQVYGEIESTLGTFDFGDTSLYWRDFAEWMYSPYKVTFGPHPDDWKIWFDVRSDEFALEFWNLIEQHRFGWKAKDEDINIPGAWTGD